MEFTIACFPPYVCYSSSVGVKTNKLIESNIGHNYMSLLPSLLVAEEETATQIPLKPSNTQVMLTRPIHPTFILPDSSHNLYNCNMSVYNGNSYNNCNNYNNSNNLLLANTSPPADWTRIHEINARQQPRPNRYRNGPSPPPGLNAPTAPPVSPAGPSNILPPSLQSLLNCIEAKTNAEEQLQS